MAIKVSILGLGRQGASLAAALAPRRELDLLGYDPDPDTGRLAQSRKLIAQVTGSPQAAAAEADLVVLALPLAQQRGLLQLMAASLREGCVITSLGALLAPPIGWAAETLSAGRHFVASHPLLNPLYLTDVETDLAGARPDLFANAPWALAPAPGCAPEALKAASDLAALTGAHPFFVDPVEHDGLMGGADALPTLLAWATMRVARTAPSWVDLRRMSGGLFAWGTAPLADPAPVSLNPQAALHYLDAALAELQAVRARLAAGDQAGVDQLLEETAAGRAEWLSARLRNEWEEAAKKPELPSAGDSLSRFFLGGLLGRKKDG